VLCRLHGQLPEKYSIISCVNAKFKFLYTSNLGHIMWGSVDGSQMTKGSLYTKALLHNVGTLEHVK
jgi:hypothetical protein